MRIGWHTQRPNPKHASARLRVHGPMALLEARGHECVFYDGAQKPDGLDCIVISKSFTSTAHRVLDRIGIVVVDRYRADLLGLVQPLLDVIDGVDLRGASQ